MPKICVEEHLACAMGIWKIYSSPGKILEKLLLKKSSCMIQEIKFCLKRKKERTITRQRRKCAIENEKLAVDSRYFSSNLFCANQKSGFPFAKLNWSIFFLY